MPARKKQIVIAAAFVLLGLVAIHTPLIPGGAASGQRHLQARADRAVADAGAADWADIAMKGQRALVRGAAPTSAAQSAVLDALDDIPGITSVAFAPPPPEPTLAPAARPNQPETLRAPDPEPTPVTAAPAVLEAALVEETDDLSAPASDSALDEPLIADAPADDAGDIADEAGEDIQEDPETETEIENETPPAPALSAAGAACQSAIDAAKAGRAITFDFDTVAISSQSGETLDAIAGALQSCGTASVRIEGHTDSSGAPAYNVYLSNIRADAVRNALAARGVGEAQLSSLGFGASRPIADNATREGRRANRRIAFVVIEDASVGGSDQP